jgi:uncharacterized protein DUF2608/NUDIX domain-containing protein
MKKYVLLLIYFLLSIGSVSAEIKVQKNLASYDQFMSWFQTKNFNPETTAVFYDIDNTLVREKPPLLNHDLFGDQSDQAKEVANRLRIPFKMARELHKQIRKLKHQDKTLEVIEPSLVNVLGMLQEIGILNVTTTASQFAKSDKRIALLKANGIDFSQPFQSQFYKGEILPFHKSRGEDDWSDEAYFGQASSSGMKKSQKIREIVNAINEIRIKKGVPLIDTVIFIDNTKKKVDEVVNNLSMDVYGLYYTFVKDHTNIDDLTEQFQLAMSQLDIIGGPSGNKPCIMPEGEIQSANVLLVGKKEDGRAYVYLGQSAKKNNLYELPGGHCEVKDPSAYHTAARESHEETGGYLNITPEFLETMPYIFADKDHGNRAVFIVRDDNLDIKAMNKTIKRALADEGLSRYFKEIRGYVKMRLKDFLRLIKSNSKSGKIAIEKGGKRIFALKPNTSKTLISQFNDLKTKLYNVLELQ